MSKKRWDENFGTRCCFVIINHVLCKYYRMSENEREESLLVSLAGLGSHHMCLAERKVFDLNFHLGLA